MNISSPPVVNVSIVTVFCDLLDLAAGRCRLESLALSIQTQARSERNHKVSDGTRRSASSARSPGWEKRRGGQKDPHELLEEPPSSLLLTEVISFTALALSCLQEFHRLPRARSLLMCLSVEQTEKSLKPNAGCRGPKRLPSAPMPGMTCSPSEQAGNEQQCHRGTGEETSSRRQVCPAYVRIHLSKVPS